MYKVIKNIIKHPIFLYPQDINDICSPLRRLGITYFSHVRITNQNQLSGISCNPLFMEHYFKNQYYLSDIHQIDAEKIGKFIVWDAIEFTKVGEKICIESNHLGVHNPFTIINKSKKFIDYYHFASSSIDKKINQVYLANIELLQHFILYFNEKIQQSSQLKRAYDWKFDMRSNKKVIMTNFNEEIMIYNKNDFFKSTNLHKTLIIFDNTEILLSKRQNEILSFIIKGKTIKEISRILYLSPRTVGHYYETLKNKLNVSTKSELISKIMESK